MRLVPLSLYGGASPHTASAHPFLRVIPVVAMPLLKSERPPLVVLSDASFAAAHTWLGFVVACPIRGVCWSGMPTPTWLLLLLQETKARRTCIGQLEAIAALAPYWSLARAMFMQRFVMHHVDNQGALYALIKSSCADEDGYEHVRLSCSLALCYVWC